MTDQCTSDRLITGLHKQRCRLMCETSQYQLRLGSLVKVLHLTCWQVPAKVALRHIVRLEQGPSCGQVVPLHRREQDRDRVSCCLSEQQPGSQVGNQNQAEMLSEAR